MGGKMYRLQGGYVQSDEARLELLNASLAQFEKEDGLDKVRNASRIGLHEDVEVTSTAGAQKLVGKPSRRLRRSSARRVRLTKSRPSRRVGKALPRLCSRHLTRRRFVPASSQRSGIQ